MVNPTKIFHDMEGTFKIETNCQGVSVDLSYPGENLYYHNEWIEVDGGVWVLDFTFDSSKINDEDNYKNLLLDVFCSRTNGNSNGDPYLLIETTLNGRLLASNSDSTSGVGVSCDHGFSVYSTGEYKQYRADC